MTLTPEQITNALAEPEMAAHLADLVYIQDEHLSIHRKKYGKGFTYLINNKDRVTDKKEIDRIKALVIPPGWKDVRISGIENGHLQSVGRDDKGRKVYRYHDLWNVLRNQTKFFKMSAFAKALPNMRKQLEKDLELNGMPLNKCLAIVLSVMDATHIRVGSEQYARRNKTYGLSTLRTKHVDDTADGIEFHFNGKKGVQQTKNIIDADLVELIHQCEEIPGWELFQYYDESGKHHGIDSGMVNDYIHRIGGEIFTAKDFRTWGATTTFFETVLELPKPESEKEKDKNILKGYDAAAEELGNTRAVCRQYYVHPEVPNIYQDDNFEPYRKKARNYKDKNHMTASERCVQEIIENFEIEFKLDE
ncbi:DNA topoisomerase-1 [Nonlabens sp. Hel1_33_55]|uniref:DNA topoisomerase IB n=1 Tax=Nonlabens sp. Hel1_33_55 TaxID=1336802 RepID=UPI000875EF48|nr:DNA topoisomerase IB [Nonlabens sp. Hel1_33_55]SCX91149.1 DNA topoisomerase-1 [Nonlabens sp. Hel1_33_55]